jgi:hypothetical protein
MEHDPLLGLLLLPAYLSNSQLSVLLRSHLLLAISTRPVVDYF